VRIRVVGHSSLLNEHERAYVEYRMFTRLAPLARAVASVLVVVSRDEELGDTCCAASAELGDSGCIRANTRHPHPGAAIDDAADKLVAAVRKRLQPAPTA
jgi:ribosome-associated translation inhibitor RaiA